jgi:hypothetical protein
MAKQNKPLSKENEEDDDLNLEETKTKSKFSDDDDDDSDMPLDDIEGFEDADYDEDDNY